MLKVAFPLIKQEILEGIVETPDENSVLLQVNIPEEKLNLLKTALDQAAGQAALH